MRAPFPKSLRFAALLGLMLSVYGMVAGSRTTSDVAPVTNVNLWWGLVMLAFGIVMLLMARRAMVHPAPPHTHPHREE